MQNGIVEDANQYTPVFNGVSAWQLYNGAGYAAPVEYRFDAWMHVKIIFAGTKAEIYIDSDEPVLHVHDLKRDITPGRVGVNVAKFAPAYFANFKVSALADAYELPHRTADDEQTPAGLVTSWLVSDAFDGDLLARSSTLDRKLQSERTWTELWTKNNGVANLARVQGLVKGKDTVFAGLVFTSDRDQLKELVFGYSDAASVYLNGTLIYKGNNAYQSRDYRYLGTIGLFDAIMLPLAAGDNELWIAVSEAFGGWGVMAEIPDRDGLTMREAHR